MLRVEDIILSAPRQRDTSVRRTSGRANFRRRPLEGLSCDELRCQSPQHPRFHRQERRRLSPMVRALPWRWTTRPTETRLSSGPMQRIRRREAENASRAAADIQNQKLRLERHDQIHEGESKELISSDSSAGIHSSEGSS
jgi:hypothetical protein